MKKLFTMPDGLLSVVEESQVYELMDCDEENDQVKLTFYNASGQPLPDYPMPSYEHDPDDEQDAEDSTQVTPMIDGFYGYTTHDIRYFPGGGMDGLFGIKKKGGAKVTEEIFAEVDECYCYGLLSVRNKDNLWGCIDETGNMVIPYKFHEPLRFNQYGLAVGDGFLVDRNGNNIPDTKLNIADGTYFAERYFLIGLLSDAQQESIRKCGRAENIRFDIYDTKLQQHVARNIPEGKIDVEFFKGEPEVILAALELISDYDTIELDEVGTIFAKKGKYVTLFDYYL